MGGWADPVNPAAIRPHKAERAGKVEQGARPPAEMAGLAAREEPPISPMEPSRPTEETAEMEVPGVRTASAATAGREEPAALGVPLAALGWAATPATA
jgi:hypothetical protein